MTPTTEAGRALLDWFGGPLSEEAALAARIIDIEQEARDDIESASMAAGLPRDAALWYLLDTVSKRAVTRVLDALVGEVATMPYLPVGATKHDMAEYRDSVLALISAHRPKGGPDRETWGSHPFAAHPTLPDYCVWTDGAWSACKAPPDAPCHRPKGDL